MLAVALAALTFASAGNIYVGDRAVARGEEPTWSPDGKHIAFVRSRDIYVANADGANARRLTTSAAVDESPAWSPDGRRLAFASNRNGQFEIYVVPAGGGKVWQVTRRKQRWQESRTPSWSPDGRRIVFSGIRTSFFNADLYVIRADGRAQRRLTFTNGSETRLADEGMPDWSPDGKQIVFVSNRDQKNMKLYVMNANGTNQRRVTATKNARGADEIRPRFSPDGKQIVFTLGKRIATINADGSGLTRHAAGTTGDLR